MIVFLLSLFLIYSPVHVFGDTPANCSYEDVEGQWIFYESERSMTSKLDCSDVRDPSLAPVRKVKIQLKFPNVAIDQFGNEGTWTMVYNQGFEVTVSGRSYFAFLDYGNIPDPDSDQESQFEEIVSFCNRTKPGNGWSHDVTVRNWACFNGRLIGDYVEKTHYIPKQQKVQEVFTNGLWEADLINQAQSSWVAGVYQEFQGLPVETIIKMKGGRKSVLFNKPSPRVKRALVSNKEGKALKNTLPESWDWRNVSGVSYVSEVRNQGGCGSCYAFSSMGMLEARVKLKTRNANNYVFSTQDVVSCSLLSQGCEGGFPYLVAGRYGKDYGVVEELCNPYKGKDELSCTTKECLRHYTASYSYVGGYYGACTEEGMKRALVENGPLSVSFEVYKDFTMYKSGVYHHTGLLQGHPGFRPFELTNHAVLLVGYGRDAGTGEDFWTIKNSWGSEWGEEGYFRIRRGTDECAVESLAVEADPIP